MNLGGTASYLASFGSGGLFNWAIFLEGAEASDLFTGDDEKTVITGSYTGQAVSFGSIDLPKAETTNMFVTEVNNSLGTRK